MSGLLNKLRSLEAEKPKLPASSTLCREPCHREASFPLSLFGSFSEATAELLEKIYNVPFPRDLKKEKLLFLDTETTGLAGGAGTVAFQIGIGYFAEKAFHVEQYLIHSYGEEAAMLTALSRRMKNYSVIVTFNGRSFDVPLLQSRLIMNRLPVECIPSLHADVLYPARRLWKLRLGRCNLGHLEEALLGVSRREDLPGALVPQTWFQYQKDGDFAPLERILDHNRQDIVSLAQLFFYVCRFAAHPEQADHDEDLFSLSKELTRQGQKDRARKCYRLLSRGAFRPEAFLALARDAKHSGHEDRAAILYKTMLRRGEHPVEACIALAKLQEHQFKNPDAALAYTRQALMLLAEPGLRENPSFPEIRRNLQHRYERLIRKTTQKPG